MSETSVVQEIENELIESGQFRYEPQYPSEVAAAIEEAELHRVNGAFRGHFNMDYPGDTFKIITDKPRKLADEDVLANYGARHMWWLRFSPEFYGEMVANPFEADQSETQFVIQDDKAVSMIFNFSETLKPWNQETLVNAFDWMNIFTHGQFQQVRRIIVTDDIVLGENPFGGEPFEQGKVLGLHYPHVPDTVLLHGSIFDAIKDGPVYEALLGKGVNLSDIIATHEFAHAIANKEILKKFASITDWQTHKYSFGKRRNKQTWEITGQGNNLPALPRTPMGDYNAKEDFAETVVLYRFDSDTLDDARYNFMTELSQSYATNWYEDPQPSPVSVERTSQPIYPYHRVPTKIGARVLTAAQLYRLGAYDRLADEVSGAVDMMGLTRRHFDTLDRMDEARR